jgi:hypothetical protein
MCKYVLKVTEIQVIWGPGNIWYTWSKENGKNFQECYKIFYVLQKKKSTRFFWLWAVTLRYVHLQLSNNSEANLRQAKGWQVARQSIVAPTCWWLSSRNHLFSHSDSLWNGSVSSAFKEIGLAIRPPESIRGHSSSINLHLLFFDRKYFF